MGRNNLRYALFCLCILALLAVFFLTLDCYWTGIDPPEKRVADGTIKDKPQIYSNRGHLEYSVFLKNAFREIEKDPRHCKKIYLLYGETLTRKLELKTIVVYWMREE